MSLYEALKKRGYTFRQHLEEEDWGLRKLTVVDLDIMLRDGLERHGIAGLKAALDERIHRPARGLWTFPCFDIREPLPRKPDMTLAHENQPVAAVVAPKANAALWTMAGAWVKLVAGLHNVHLSLLDADAVALEETDGRDLVLFGGSHQNRLALALALRHRTFFADAGVPGEDGWLATMHCGTDKSGRNVLQVAAPAVHRATVLRLLCDATVRLGPALVVRHVHHVQQGTAMAARFPSWAAYTAKLPSRLPHLLGKSGDTPQEPAALAGLLAQGFYSGGPEKNIYNAAVWDVAVDCARYYQLSADKRALCLFRELLFRATDYYLKTPGGASYPSDLDFRLGLLVLHYARLEHEPIFTDEDRLVLANLLLACTRSIHEYAAKMWPPDRYPATRQNHQTFPALSLLYCADYFARFGSIDVTRWRAYSDAVFSGPLWKRSKQCENGRLYEPLVFEHAAEYSAFLSRGLSLFDPSCFETMVMRQIAATDNFFRPVDYGDTAISMGPAQSPSARLQATQKEDVVRWFAGEAFARQPNDLPPVLFEFPGLNLGSLPAPPGPLEWEYAPVDPLFLQEMAPGLPRAAAFDKLAFRTGWKDEDQYLLIEGVTGSVSHGHCDTNGIVRYNHLGRHWIVSNGYGYRVGVTNVVKSFSSRERGPVDHNMLVLRRAGEIVRDLPMAALLQRGQQGRMLYMTSALLNYGGVNWFRTLLLLTGGYLLVLDRVQVIEPGIESAHVEWNALGNAAAQRQGFRLEQQGVFLGLTSPSDWAAEQTGAGQSACWKRVLEDGSYPYATFPLVKIRFHMPETEPGEARALATLLAATRSGMPYTLSQPEAGRLVVAGSHPQCDGLRISDGDLAIRADGNHCELRFAPAPAVPDALLHWSRGRMPRTENC